MDIFSARFQPVSISFGGPLTPVVRRLLWANGLVFLVEVLLVAIPRVEGGYALFLHLFGLVPARVLTQGWVWQLFTYMFVHEVTTLFHILWNLLMLWMFGGEIERAWGSRAFLRYYLITGVGAGLTVLAVTPGSPIPTIGASGALFGLLLAYGMQFPNRVLYVFLVVPMRARWVVVFSGLVTLYSLLVVRGGGVSHLAHLGGLVVGWLYLKRVWRIRQLVAELRWHWRRRRFRVYGEEDRRDRRDPWVH